MKTCFLCTGGYTGAVTQRGWPVPPELCDRQEAAKSYETAIRNCKRAEEAGFDWVSISEHHYAPGLMTPNPVVLAAALSQATSRVKIALLGPLVPLVNPVRTAEEIAMLDALSGGRVVVLFLRGTPNEHHTYGGIDPAETRTITQEGVQLIKKAWTEPKPFSWDSAHFHFKTVSVWPRTLQDPHPQIFYSGNSDESAEFAGRNHLSVAIGFAGVTQVKRQVEIYKAAAREAGWEPTHDNVLFRGPDDRRRGRRGGGRDRRAHRAEHAYRRGGGYDRWRRWRRSDRRHRRHPVHGRARQGAGKGPGLARRGCRDPRRRSDGAEGTRGIRATARRAPARDRRLVSWFRSSPHC
jgi:alkanesulfonate monooxygenase SsuD/methylene tetrahydromethanopterin reductase-like flavin-dependent oxidoreductase (luciferase family)